MLVIAESSQEAVEFEIELSFEDVDGEAIEAERLQREREELEALLAAQEAQ